ncbi:MAG TPA: hypothetical protein VF728_04760 [Nocardioides sp.]|jgi:hypothetical protein
MRKLPAAVAALLLAGALTACGSTEEPTDGASAGESPSTSAGESPSESATTSPKGDGSGDNAGTVEIVIEGGEVSPAGERVEAEVGSELVLEITADQPGSMHVHSHPEQEIHFGKGTTTAAVAIDQPGIIEVELHDPTVVVLQIQAS